MTKDVVVDLEKFRSYLNAYYAVSDELFALLCKLLSPVLVAR